MPCVLNLSKGDAASLQSDAIRISTAREDTVVIAVTPCLAIAREIESLQQCRAEIQTDLRRAARGERAAIAAEIAELNTEIADARRRLRQCEGANGTPVQPGVLGPGRELAINHSIAAPGGFTRLTLQPDGNLVLYTRRAAGEVARWASCTQGQPVTACLMQTDGNLVLYNGRQPVWASGPISPGAELRVQDDENLVIYQGGTPIWTSETSLDGTPVKGDGAKVYYLREGVRHWIPDSKTLETQFGGWGAVTAMPDGELALWPEGDPMPAAR